VAEMDMERDSRRDKALCLPVKYMLKILQMEREEF
jgi:hypothetical protein